MDFNIIIKDETLTMKAKGIYFMIKAMKENNIPVSKQYLIDHSKDGKASITSAWNELKDNGYLEVKITGAKDKRGFEYHYNLMK